MIKVNPVVLIKFKDQAKDRLNESLSSFFSLPNTKACNGSRLSFLITDPMLTIPNVKIVTVWSWLFLNL